MPPRRLHREETKVNDRHTRYTRLRYTATGALAALAAVGAIAGTVALAAKPHARAAVVSKTPTSPGPDKTGTPAPPASPQPFLNDIQQLVDTGTITATEGQAVDREIQAGGIDTDTLASSGFTQAQLQAVQQALGNTKRSMAAALPRAQK
jgi:hypothetical protein